MSRQRVNKYMEVDRSLGYVIMLLIVITVVIGLHSCHVVPE